VTGNCALTGGSWFSWYDDLTIDNATALDIDHLVPLAEAWDSGASKWAKARRVDYANYLSRCCRSELEGCVCAGQA
jgi:hypothetical protein